MSLLHPTSREPVTHCEIKIISRLDQFSELLIVLVLLTFVLKNPKCAVGGILTDVKSGTDRWSVEY
ncbi:MAG: hypothetical protein P8K08_17100 [Fuerstiella sp.]|nr:hypothetical protein [Fuerstiella sp.]